MKYVNLTPRWEEILSVWKTVIESCNSVKRNHREKYNKNMGDFWHEVKRMARGADNYNDLLTFLRKRECWSDDIIEKAVKIGREINERERNTVKESEDDHVS